MIVDDAKGHVALGASPRHVRLASCHVQIIRCHVRLVTCHVRVAACHVGVTVRHVYITAGTAVGQRHYRCGRFCLQALIGRRQLRRRAERCKVQSKLKINSINEYIPCDEYYYFK